MEKKTLFKIFGFLVLVFVSLASCTKVMYEPFTLYSNSFANDGLLPDKFSSGSGAQFPSLFWKNPPANTSNYLVIVENVEQKKAVILVHSISSSLRSIPELSSPVDFSGIGSATASWSGLDISNTVHYFFKLYALNAPLSPGLLTRDEFETTYAGYILGSAEINGSYLAPAF